MKFKIIADSASDLDPAYLDGTGVDFCLAPLSLRVGEREYVDDPSLDPAEMLAALRKSKSKSSSACPAPEDYLKHFEGADYYFVTTITSKLSGSFNSATVARNIFACPERVHVIDSKGTCGSEILIVDELVRLIRAGKSYEEIVAEIEAFRDRRELLFVLQRFDNLVENGRMSRAASLIASTLVIRPVCRAVDGEIKIAKKVIGAKNAFAKMVSMIKEMVPNPDGREIIISHCYAEEEAAHLEAEFAAYGFAKVRVLPTRGLASYYALERGVIVCF